MARKNASHEAPDYHARYGRRYAPDNRDLGFRMTAARARVDTIPTSRYWELGPQLDQGNTPRCVGNATRQLLTASPHRFGKPSPTADEIYAGARQNDEWPGEDYEGTSARGAMKFLQSLGIIAAYHWATTVQEAAQFVLTTGPVLVGSWWYEGMETTDERGFVHPHGNKAGGHEYLWYGYNLHTRILSFDNSWGSQWGIKGRFKMHEDVFALLIADEGDLVAPVEA